MRNQVGCAYAVGVKFWKWRELRCGKVVLGKKSLLGMVILEAHNMCGYFCGHGWGDNRWYGAGSWVRRWCV